MLGMQTVTHMCFIAMIDALTSFFLFFEKKMAKIRTRNGICLVNQRREHLPKSTKFLLKNTLPIDSITTIQTINFANNKMFVIAFTVSKNRVISPAQTSLRGNVRQTDYLKRIAMMFWHVARIHSIAVAGFYLGSKYWMRIGIGCKQMMRRPVWAINILMYF